MLNLLEALGIDPADFSWRDLAACQNMPVNTLNYFFEDYELSAQSNTQQLARQMDILCSECPVRRSCIRDALDKKESGLRAGIYLDNGKMDESRNVHKTREDWKRITNDLFN